MYLNIIAWFVTLLLLGVPFLARLWGRKPFLRAAAVSVALLLFHFLWVFVPGWVLRVKAERGDPAAMYELARWTENHDEQFGSLVLWPVIPDVLGGYAWLEKAAAQEYPPAVYAVGVRLKYGEHVPRPPDWPSNQMGNYFPQPERGQALIDKALALGYQPTIDEKEFYRKQYRERYY
jgi:TPR repeat protein